MVFNKKRFTFKIVFPVLILLLLLYCEYLHNYLVIKQCYWPNLKSADGDITVGIKKNESLQVLVITDIHLLGPRRGTWVEKKFRDWKMKNTFQMLVSLLKPEIVFVLGDIFDEGLYLNPVEFEEHVQRFRKGFAVPDETKLYVVVGNHDIGFHHEIRRPKNELFINAFNSPSIQLITEKENHFLLLNSMAMHGDSCFLCRPTMEKLNEIEKILKCAKEASDEFCKHIDKNARLKTYSKPILIQHYPLYRPSDMECNDFDAGSLFAKEELFQESRECLSKNATMQLLGQIEPRLALSGHTHHGCTKKLALGDGVEITIPSFNWRNKNNPTVGLGVFTPDNYSFVRCPLPQQSTWMMLYVTGFTVILIWTFYGKLKISRRNNQVYLNLSLFTR